jgi:hypothetical protein
MRMQTGMKYDQRLTFQKQRRKVVQQNVEEGWVLYYYWIQQFQQHQQTAEMY